MLSKFIVLKNKTKICI